MPGVGATLGEVCREYLNGRCAKSDCRFNHPPHSLLMTALAAATTMGTLSQVPMAPSAAAMAAAQAIVAAQALQAHAAQAQAQSNHRKDTSGMLCLIKHIYICIPLYLVLLHILSICAVGLCLFCGDYLGHLCIFPMDYFDGCFEDTIKFSLPSLRGYLCRIFGFS